MFDLMRPEIASLPGGVNTTIFRMKKDDAQHQAALHHALYDAIKHEAAVHEAVFHGEHFRKVIEAAEANKIQAWFIMAALESCGRRTGGVAVEFPTVYTERDGNDFKHYPAIYGEDTCVLPGTAKAFREETSCGQFPKGLGLGSWFEQERIRLQATQPQIAPFGMVPRARIGEYFGGNAPIIGMLRKFGTNLVPNEDCAVLKLDGLTPSMERRLRLPVEIEGLKSPDASDAAPNVFLATWTSEDGQKRIVASFTEGLSTFMGDPIVRVQLTSNGDLPRNEVLKDALVSLLRAGRSEVNERLWGSYGRNAITQFASPIIPIGAFGPEVRAASLISSREEMSERRWKVNKYSPLFGGRVPVFHIHANEEPGLISALREMNAAIRTLGPHAMLPAVMDFKNIPKEALSFHLVPSRPLNVVSLAGSANVADIGLAA